MTTLILKLTGPVIVLHFILYPFLYLLKLLILYLSQQCCMIKRHKDPLKRIQLSLFVFVLGAILYYSITMLSAVGISPIQLTTATTTNTTSDEVTFLNSKGMSLNSLGKFNESITYFDKVLSGSKKYYCLNSKG